MHPQTLRPKYGRKIPSFRDNPGSKLPNARGVCWTGPSLSQQMRFVPSQNGKGILAQELWLMHMLSSVAQKSALDLTWV